MRLPEDPDIPPQINIVPMIDVIFAILTFFMVSSLYLTRSEGLPVNLPTAATAEQQAARSPINLRLDSQGQLSLNGQSTSLRNLPTQIQQLTGGAPAQVIINADTSVSHGRVVAVMDQLRTIRGVRIAIAAQRP